MDRFSLAHRISRRQDRLLDRIRDRRTAEARYYYTVLHGTKSSPLGPVISGRYEDEFRSDGDSWTLVTRREYVDLVGDLSAYLSADSARSLSAPG